MKTYRIVHTEKLVGWFYVEANSPEEAIKEYQRQASNGELDFSDMDIVDGEDVVEEEM